MGQNEGYPQNKIFTYSRSQVLTTILLTSYECYSKFGTPEPLPIFSFFGVPHQGHSPSLYDDGQFIFVEHVSHGIIEG